MLCRLAFRKVGKLGRRDKRHCVAVTSVNMITGILSNVGREFWMFRSRIIPETWVSNFASFVR